MRKRKNMKYASLTPLQQIPPKSFFPPHPQSFLVISRLITKDSKLANWNLESKFQKLGNKGEVGRQVHNPSGKPPKAQEGGWRPHIRGQGGWAGCPQTLAATPYNLAANHLLPCRLLVPLQPPLCSAPSAARPAGQPARCAAPCLHALPLLLH